MQKFKITKIILITILLLALYIPDSVQADVEWTLKKQSNLDAVPLDITSSPDGQWIYILTSGEIAVFSILGDHVASRIPVDKTFDRISYAAQTNTLTVSSSTGKMLKLIQLEVIQKFSLDGLAFKGPEKAPVTIAVFSDYQ